MRKPRNPFLRSTVLTTFILLIWAISLASDPHWPAIAISVCALAGIVLCLSIILYRAGKENSITRRLCVREGKFSCTEVLEKGKLGKDLSIADVGIIYFSAQLIYLWVSATFHSSRTAPAILSIPISLAVLTTIGLIFWQAFFIRQWCRMCLLITAIVWLQFLSIVVFVPHAFSLLGKFSAVSGYSFLFSTCVASLWIIVKPWLASMEEHRRIKTMLFKWKNNTRLFWAILKEQRAAVDPRDWDDEIILGDAQAPTRLLFILSPFCPLCAREFRQLSVLLRKPGIRLGASIRFGIKTLGDHRAQGVKAILAACAAYPNPSDRMQILRDWFHIKNIVAFTTKWPLTSAGKVEVELSRHQQFSQENKIAATPIYFLNGYELPEIYKLSDLYIHLAHPPTATKPLYE